MVYHEIPNGTQEQGFAMAIVRPPRSGGPGENQLPNSPRMKMGQFMRKRPLNARRVTMMSIWNMPPMETVELIKTGLSADFLTRLSRDLDRPMRYVVLTIGMAPTSASRKIARQTPLAPDESERALGIGKLIGQAESIVQQSGRAEGFDAGKW